MSAQTGDHQQVSKGLLITLGVVAAIGVAFALWVFVIEPMGADDDPVAMDEAGAEADEPADDDALDDAPGDDDLDDGDEPADEAEDDEAADDEDVDDADEPLESAEVVTARDPFQQLVADTGAATVGTGEPGTGTATGAGEADDGDDGDDADRADVGSTTVTLVDIYTDDDGLERATVEVDGTGYDVIEGETFADRFQLLDIADGCATLLYGDSRFTLCEGDRIRK